METPIEVITKFYWKMGPSKDVCWFKYQHFTYRLTFNHKHGWFWSKYARPNSKVSIERSKSHFKPASLEILAAAIGIPSASLEHVMKHFTEARALSTLAGLNDEEECKGK